MKQIFAAFLCTAALLASGPTRAGANDDGAAAAANAFYAAYEKAQPRGIPDAKAQVLLGPLLSASLNGALDRARKAGAAFQAKTRGMAPPLLQGDIFTSLFEGATAYTIGACTSDGLKLTRCKVNLTYSDPQNPPTHWTDIVALVREGDAWKIDDIVYGGNWDFASKGTLSQTLAQVVEDATGSP
jgi:hypothetical protein